MTISERHFSCPILSRLNLMSKPFNLKYLILYVLPTQSCSRLGTGQTTCAIFAKGNQKLLDIIFFWDCPYSNSFWKCVESYYLGLRKQLVHLTLKEIWIGFLSSECPLLNYLILIGKIYLWSCRRNELLPTINSFIVRINGKYEIEKYIFTKNKNLQKLMDKWTL